MVRLFGGTRGAVSSGLRARRGREGQGHADERCKPIGLNLEGAAEFADSLSHSRDAHAGNGRPVATGKFSHVQSLALILDGQAKLAVVAEE